MSQYEDDDRRVHDEMEAEGRDHTELMKRMMSTQDRICKDFDELLNHYGHELSVATYHKVTHPDKPSSDEVMNVAIECETCNEVLVSHDNPRLNNPGGD